MYSFSDLFQFHWPRSLRKMSRYPAHPRGYRVPITVKPPKPLRQFTVKGHTIMAYSRKDAIKRLKHKKLI